MAERETHWSDFAATEILRELDGRKGLTDDVDEDLRGEIHEAIACIVSDRASAAVTQLSASHRFGCACRWNASDERIATCKRHQGWLDVVHEWAERAKTAEAKLARIADSAASPSEGDPAVLRAIARGEQ
jgi:hypothetical protein